MKKFLAALLTAALIISSSAILVPLTVSAADEVPYENMIALYNMDGVMKDSVSGKGGTLKNGANFVNDSERGSVLYLNNDDVVSPGTGAGYDEEGQHAVLADSHIPNSDQMTISLWFNSKELRNWARVIDFGDAKPEKEVSNNPDRFIGIVPTNGTHTIGTVNINDSTAGIPNNRDRVWADLVAENEWVHAALVINAGSGKPNVLYVNGVPFESTNGGADDDAVPATFSPKDILSAPDGVGSTFLGRSRYENNGDQIFNGYIDDVAIFDTALTAEQVAALAEVDLNSIAAGIAVGTGTTTVEAVDFDSGVYYESNPAEVQRHVRTGEEVQTEVGESGYKGNIGWTAADEWVQYTVKTEFGGKYKLEAYLASGAGEAGNVEVSCDDTVVGATESTDTDGWQAYGWYDIGEVEMTAGQHIIKVLFLDGNTNLAAIRITGVEIYYPDYPLSVNFYDIPAPMSGEIMFGELIGAEGGWGDNPETGRSAAFDSNPSTFYDPAEKANTEHYAGIQMEEPYILTEIRILPRTGQTGRFNGASIWGFNDEAFDLETATLIWESGAAADAAEFQIITAEDFLVSDAAFTHFVYFNQVEHGDVAEVELYGVPESDSSVFDGDTLTVGMIYLFAAEQIANVSNSAEALLADPNAYIENSGLLTQNDKIRYYMETGYKFDFDAPVTRQEYARIINRMFNLLKKYGIELVQKTEQQYRGSNIEQNQGIGRVDSFASGTSEYGIGVIPYYEQHNVGIGGISSNNIHAASLTNSYNRQTLDTYTDGSEVRGSTRTAVAEMFSLGILKPKSFADKQIFFIQDPKAKAEDKVELYSDEFYAKNEAAKARLENYYINRYQQVVLEKGLFIAPNDILTESELEDLITILANTLKASGYTERAVMAPIMSELLQALEAFETDVTIEVEPEVIIEE